MTVQHLEVLTEELSMAALLETLLPRLLPAVRSPSTGIRP